MANKAKIVIEVDAETGARQIEKISKAQEKVSESVKKTGREAKATTKEADGLVASFTKLAAGAISIGALVGVVHNLRQEMEQLSRDTNNTMVSFKSLAGIQANPTQMRDVAKQAHALGVQNRMGPAEAANTVQVMQSLFGEQAGWGAAEQAMKLRRLDTNMTAEGALNVLQFGKAAGMSPVQSSNAAIVAADTSAYDIAKVAETFTALQGYRDPVEGAAAISAMSESFDSGQLGTYVRIAGLNLSDPNSTWVKGMTRAAKRKGINWEEASLQQRLGVIAGEGQTDATALAKGGLNEMRAQLAIAALVKSRGKAADIESQIRGTEGNLVDTKLANMEANFPEMAIAGETTQAQLTAEYAKTWGPRGAQAQGYGLRSAQRKQFTAEMGLNPAAEWSITKFIDLVDAWSTSTMGDTGQYLQQIVQNTKDKGSASGLALGGGHGGTP